MTKDQIVGLALLIASLAGIAIYTYLVFLAPQWIQTLTLKLTAFAAVGAVLLIVAWIGYTLATTPPPKPIEEIEKELEEELKKLEQELEEEKKEETQETHKQAEEKQN